MIHVALTSAATLHDVRGEGRKEGKIMSAVIVMVILWVMSGEREREGDR